MANCNRIEVKLRETPEGVVVGRPSALNFVYAQQFRLCTTCIGIRWSVEKSLSLTWPESSISVSTAHAGDSIQRFILPLRREIR
jgi:hypothetical protein